MKCEKRLFPLPPDSRTDSVGNDKRNKLYFSHPCHKGYNDATETQVTGHSRSAIKDLGMALAMLGIGTHGTY